MIYKKLIVFLFI